MMLRSGWSSEGETRRTPLSHPTRDFSLLEKWTRSLSPRCFTVSLIFFPLTCSSSGRNLIYPQRLPPPVRGPAPFLLRNELNGEKAADVNKVNKTSFLFTFVTFGTFLLCKNPENFKVVVRGTGLNIIFYKQMWEVTCYIYWRCVKSSKSEIY